MSIYRVLYSEDKFKGKAINIAEHFDVTAELISDAADMVADTKHTAEKKKLSICVTAEGVALTDGRNSMQGDFTKMLPRLRYNNLTHETVVKAAKGKNIPENARILDATAGMGEDSLLLAAAGFQMTLCEYNPVIAALLRDTLERSADIPELTETVSRMQLLEEDSTEVMKAAAGTYDVILLDPMFPERKKSGLVKKKFQLLQQLETPCSTEEELLEAAIAAAPKRIMIKRPMKGPNLAGRKPSYSLKGKSIRYDVIVL